MLDYEEIFEESETVTEETTTAVVTEVTTTPYTEVVTTQNVTEETTTVFYDEYGFEVTTSSTELEAICSYVSDMYLLIQIMQSTECKRNVTKEKNKNMKVGEKMKVLKIRRISKRRIKPEAWLFDEEFGEWIRLPY